MISSIVSRLVILVFGTLYPAYASYKAVRTKNVREYVKWMMYWIVFALFSCAETFTDVFLSFWFPFYYEIKILLVLWLLSPATKGSSILYRKFVHPMLSRREQDIDEYIARAKEQGYHTVLHLGTKGVNYATTVIMQTAIKGGGGLVQQLRRSYSLGDLSSDVDGDSNSGRKALPEAQDRNRDRERVASSGDGRHHRPRGHSPRRSASGSGRVEMYFPEVDVDVRGATVREPSVPLSHIRSSEDVSSGYSSAEPLYQQGGVVSGGQHGASRPDSLANSREPLVRTASVGGSSRSVRTRSSRGGSGTTTKKGSSTGVAEASEEHSAGGEDSLYMDFSSPSQIRSRSNSLPMSADLLRPELVALLQALNAELEQKVSVSKLTEMKMSAATEQMERMGGTVYSDEQKTMAAVNTNELPVVEIRGMKETSQINVSESSLSDLSGINLPVDSDDIFYDSVSIFPLFEPRECQLKNEERETVESCNETVSEPGKVIILSDQMTSDVESPVTSSSSPFSDTLPNISDQRETSVVDDGGDGLCTEPVVIPADMERKDSLHPTPTPSEKAETESISDQHGTAMVDDDGDGLCTEPAGIPADVERKHTLSLVSTPPEKPETESTLFPKDLSSHVGTEGCTAAASKIHKEVCESVTACASDERPNINLSEMSTQLDEKNQIFHEKEKCLDPAREAYHSARDEVSREEGSSSKAVLDISEQIFLQRDGELSSPNDNVVIKEKQKLISDELEHPKLQTESSTSQDILDQKHLSLSATSHIVPDNTQLKEAATVDERQKIDAAETVLGTSDSIFNSQTSLNSDMCISGNSDPKKDVRAGRYHKLQAPEPPPRSRRSSSKNSISEDGELKSGHRSRSPKKTTESPVARLHSQIGDLASMLPFWNSGRRSRGKEVDAGGEGIHIREMSRSPTRRLGGQIPP